MLSALPRPWLLTALALLALPAAALAQAPSAAPAKPDNGPPYAEFEPKAKAFSSARAAEYLDEVARFWMRKNSCGACHANFAYLMARPLVGAGSSVAETRLFLEQPRASTNPDFSLDGMAVSAAFALAWDDAHTSGRLQPATRTALSRMWSLQRSYGSWDKMGCGRTVPAENDTNYLAVLAALATGVAPDGYAQTDEAKKGLAGVRRYFTERPARDLHDLALRLWASRYLDGLMTAAQQDATVELLLARQGKDGGWSLAALNSRNTPPAAEEPPSDGYGTGLAVFILRQSGVPANRSEVVRGADWLRNNQRASGRWFTPSRAADEPTEGGVGTRDLYVQNLGTAFALLALKACEEADLPGSRDRRPPVRGPGLAMRDRLLRD